MGNKEKYVYSNIIKLTQFWGGIALILGSLIVFALSIMDYFVFPDKFDKFLIYRAACGSALLFLFLINRMRAGKVYQYPIILIGSVLPPVMIELMILSTGGHTSPYYAGMILTLVFIVGFIPMSFFLAAAVSSIIQFIYIFPILYFDTITNKSLFVTHLSFLFSISIISLAWRYFTQKNLTNTFALEYELEKDRQQLRHYSTNLEQLVDERTKELNRSELMFRSLFEYASDGIIITDPDGTVVNVNQRACEIHKFDRQAFVGTNMTLLETEANKAQFKERMERILAGESLIFETQHFRKDGSKVSLEVSAQSIEIEGKKLIQAFHRDITEKKKLQQQLLHSQKMESIGQLAGGIAHDFNNILTSILGFTEIILLNENLDKSISQKVQIVENSARRATHMISKLLSFARRSSFEPVPFDVNNIISDTLDMTSRLIPRGITLAKDLYEPIPAVEGDPNQFEQVIMNLLINARDAMPDGGNLRIATAVQELGPSDIDIEAEVVPGTYVTITVADTGLGIPSESLPRIFEPFYTSKEKGKGTGLGLAMVYGIVKEHKGYITVHSAPDRGTEFNVYLPVSTDTAPKRGLVAEEQHGNRTVLVVDDELPILEFIKETLRRHNYYVIATNNPLDALNFYREISGKVDLVITDVMMPAMHGTELIETLRNINHEAKIIAVTGFHEELGALEIDAFLKKPFSATQLVSAINGILEHT